MSEPDYRIDQEFVEVMRRLRGLQTKVLSAQDDNSAVELDRLRTELAGAIADRTSYAAQLETEKANHRQTTTALKRANEGLITTRKELSEVRSTLDAAAAEVKRYSKIYLNVTSLLERVRGSVRQGVRVPPVVIADELWKALGGPVTLLDPSEPPTDTETRVKPPRAAEDPLSVLARLVWEVANNTSHGMDAPWYELADALNAEMNRE